MSALDPSIIKKTQDTLGRVIQAPALTEKLLSRPPVQFIQDIVKSVIKNTGFMKGLYRSEELESAFIKESKDNKLLFLNKLITIVSVVVHEQLPVRASKIAAGAEVEKTNDLFQNLAKAVNMKPDNDEVVKKALKKMKSDDGDEKPKEEKESRSKDKESRSSKDHEKSRDREREKGKEESSRERTKESRDKDRDRDRTRDSKKTEERDKTRERGGDRGKDREKDKDKDKERERDRHGDKEREREKDKDRHGESKERRHKERDGEKERDRDREREKDKERRRDTSGKHRESSSRKDGEDKDRDKDRDKDKDKEREKRREERHKGRRGSDAKTEEPEPVVAPPKTKITYEDDDDDGENEGNTSRKRPTSAKGPRSHIEREEDSATPARQGQAEQPDETMRTSMRPTTARPGAPRPRLTNEPEEPVQSKIQTSSKAKSTLIVNSDSDDDFVVKEQKVQEDDKKKYTREHEREDDFNQLNAGDPDQAHGALVKKILESKEQLQGGSELNRNNDFKPMVQNDMQRKKEREKIQKEIDKLKESIQTLTKASIPLGRTLEFLQEDIEMMQKELTKWTDESELNLKAFKRQQAEAQSLLEPYKGALADIENQINDQSEKIASVKRKILLNEEKTSKLLFSLGKQMHSQEKNNASVARQLKSQRTTTSQRTAHSSNHSGSNIHVKAAEKPTRPRLVDERNVDVTPKPMFETETQLRTRHGSALFESIAGTMTPTETSMSASVMNTNAILTAAQSFSAFPESSTQASVDSQTNMNPSEVPAGETSIPEKEHSAMFYTIVEPHVPKDAYERITFTETPTFKLLDIPQSCLFDEDERVESVKAKNAKYLELCKTKVGNDSYVDRGINTFNNLPKVKNTQTDRITINEKGSWCTLWDMYDSHKNESEFETQKDQGVGTSDVSPHKSEAMERRKSVGTGTINGTVISDMPGAEVVKEIEVKKEDANYQENEEFKMSAFFMERLLNQNTYQAKQARYRGLKPIITNENDLTTRMTYDGLSLEKLWTYTSSLTKDRNVSCVSWNRKNPDILAVGYGKFEYNDEQSGLVCCWSLKNPEFPERYYKTDAGVTSIAFSQKHANLLAVGLFNGDIHIYDVRTNNVTSLLSTNDSTNKHLSPVWNLKWTERDRASSTGDESEMEVLMSISSDGRITQWLIRKGFESSDYLKLKRVAVKDSSVKADKEKSEGLISRNTGGLCFDIWEMDKSIYLCGTEEGHIHRCSTSYNEQYLDTYTGHTGPVYKIAWSPFLRNCFISGSSDWTIKLWKTNRSNPCLSFNSSTKAVYDICWSNKSATIFCCVNENAIEIWDLSKSTLDPIFVTNPLAHIKLTSVTYSPNSDSLIVGTSDGSLYVYGIKNTPSPTRACDLEDIIKLSLISQLDNVKVDEDEANDFSEKHQLEAIKRDPKDDEGKEFEEGKEDTMAKMDAFQKNLDQIKTQNAKLLKDKKPKDSSKKGDLSSSDSDEN